MDAKTDLQEEMFSQIQSKQLFEQAKSDAFAYMDGVLDRNVYPTDQAIKALDIFDEPFPAKAGNPTEILHLLDEYGSPATVAQTGGRYFGFVNGGSVPAALAAKWLSDVWDQNGGMYVTSPITSQLETTCENGWLTCSGCRGAQPPASSAVLPPPPLVDWQRRATNC